MLPRPNTPNLIARQLPHRHAHLAQIRAILREPKVKVVKPTWLALVGQIRRILRKDMQKEPRPRIIRGTLLFDINQLLAFGIVVKINIKVGNLSMQR